MKRVRIAELKARLSEHLRYVRRGHVLTVLDRDTPVARLVPFESSSGPAIRVPAPKAGHVGAVPLPPPVVLPADPVTLLLEDRQVER
ncbi:MAG: type II toxin-antitoxin system Phd/YefM family antitoxin [Gemmatimonadales bacterium]